MGKDATMHVRIDPAAKEAAEEIFENMGSSLSEATRVFVNEAIKANGLPFRPISTVGKGQMKAQGILHVFAHQEKREAEREAGIRSLSDKYETFNR